MLINLKLLQKKRKVELEFSSGESFSLSCYYLRSHSPSAEKTTHIDEDVNIIGVDPVGNYAVKFIFDDGHKTGIYNWDYLYDIAKANVDKA